MQIMINANANQVIANELHEKSTAAYFKSLITDVNNRYETRFATDMQIYVTRLGIIASKAVTGRHITTPTRVHQRLSQNNLRKRQISCETTANLAK